ncbi:CD209 antigen-like protein C [Dipodomys spectabilis]|uniref:CD209 antigen-like protein C n=1 Tax=Dipodomys spectabilis TaxID=105255 RepID=UPI001C534D24|nr:CD209 antigen-like protein C [Dipodomys spectabilis]
MYDLEEERRQYLGYQNQSCLLLVLQLVSITLLVGLLVAILLQDSHDFTSQEKERIYQDLIELKAGVDHLCRPCPWDWTFFQGNCYFLSKTQGNWNYSVTACQEVGAQLVIIKSDDEQGFLVEISKHKHPSWIGFSDVRQEGNWLWLDGSPLTQRLMKYWKPDNSDSKGEDCAELRGYEWKHNKCVQEKFWICKKSSLSCSRE